MPSPRGEPHTNPVANPWRAEPSAHSPHTLLIALPSRPPDLARQCDPDLRNNTDDLWRAGQPRDPHPASCVAQSALYGGAISLAQTCVPSYPAWGYKYVGVPSWGIETDPGLATPLPAQPVCTTASPPVCTTAPLPLDDDRPNLWTVSQWIMAAQGETGLFHYQEFLLGLVITIVVMVGYRNRDQVQRLLLTRAGNQELHAAVEVAMQPNGTYKNLDERNAKEVL